MVKVYFSAQIILIIKWPYLLISNINFWYPNIVAIYSQVSEHYWESDQPPQLQLAVTMDWIYSGRSMMFIRFKENRNGV